MTHLQNANIKIKGKGQISEIAQRSAKIFKLGSEKPLKLHENFHFLGSQNFAIFVSPRSHITTTNVSFLSVYVLMYLFVNACCVYVC